MKAKDHYFYVLECNDKTLYAGYTTDVAKRTETHNSGKGAKYTRVRTPVKVIYSQVFETKSEAMKQEAAFKKLNRSQKFAWLEERWRMNNEDTVEL